MANPIPLGRKVTAGTYTYGESSDAVIVASPTSAEDSANSMTVDFAGLLTGSVDYASVQLMNSSGVVRTPGTVTWSGKIVTIAESSLATTDVLVVRAGCSQVF